MKMARKHHPIQTFDSLSVSKTHFFKKRGKVATYSTHGLMVFSFFSFWFVTGMFVFSHIYSALLYGTIITSGTYGLYGLSQIFRKKQADFNLIKLFDPKKTHKKG